MAEISDNGVDIFLEYSRAKITASSRDRSRVNGKKTITVQDQLIKALKDTPSDNIENMVSQYALQYQMGIFLYYDGAVYNLMVDNAPQADNNHSYKEDVKSFWSIPSEDIDLAYLRIYVSIVRS